MEPRERLEAGRAGYDNAALARIYDSALWRWAVGPLVYSLVVVAVSTTVFSMEIGQSVAFAGTMAAVLLVRAWIESRRQNPRQTN
jgi:hypothetical protein